MVIQRTSFIFLVLCVCMGWATEDQVESTDTDQLITYVDEINSLCSEELSKELGPLSISGSPKVIKYVEKINISCSWNQPATIEQARRIEVLVTEKLLKIVNGHEKIRPHLREYPFPLDRTEVTIVLREVDPKTSNNRLVEVLRPRNHIYYRINAGEHKKLTIKEESYEEALKIVRGKAVEGSRFHVPTQLAR